MGVLLRRLSIASLCSMMSGCGLVLFGDGSIYDVCNPATGIVISTSELCESPKFCKEIDNDPNHGFCATPDDPNTPFRSSENPTFDRLQFGNVKAGETGAVDLFVSGRQGELNVYSVEIEQLGDSSIRLLEPGEVIGSADVTAFPANNAPGVEVKDLPIIADSPTTAYIDTDGTPGKSLFDQIVVFNPSAAPGEAAVSVFNPVGGDLNSLANVNEADFIFKAKLVEGVITNPTTAGNYTLFGTAVSVDPTSGDADDGLPADPKTATITQDLTFVSPPPAGLCGEPYSSTRPPAARYFYFRNDNVGHQDGPFALPGEANPDYLQIVDPFSLQIYSPAGEPLDVMGGTWVSPGACPFTSYQGDIKTLVDGILTAHPDPEPGVCGHGCFVWDNDTPNQPPVVQLEDTDWTMEAGTEAWFGVEFVDELPNQAIGGFGGSGITFCNNDFTYTDGTRGFFAVRCTPSSLGAGTYEGTVQVQDHAFEASDSIPVTLTVTPPSETDPQQDPVADQTISQGDPVSFQMSAIDPDGAPPFVWDYMPRIAGCAVASQGTGTASLNCISGALQGAFVNFVSTVTDTGGEYSQRKFSATITEENKRPVIENPGDQNIRVNDGSRVINFSAYDENGDIEKGFSTHYINFNLSAPGECGISSFGQDNGYETFFQVTVGCYFSPGQEGTYPVTVTGTDTGTPPLTGSASFNINVVGEESNTSPVIQPVADRTITPDQAANLAVRAIDPEGDAMTIAIEGQPASCTPVDKGDGTGYLQCLPENDIGIWPLLIRVTDNRGAQTTETATLTVQDTSNLAPQIQPIEPIDAYVGDALTVNIIATDETPETVELSISAEPDGCVFTDQSNGIGVLECAAIGSGAAGLPSPMITAFDGSLSSFYTIPLQVAERPAIDPVEPVATDEGTPVSIPLVVSGGFGNFAFSVIAPTPSFCTVPNSEEPVVQCSPVVGDAGNYTVRAVAQDELGTAAQRDVDFTVRQVLSGPGLIQGAVYIDEDGNGTQDANETRRWPGVTVTAEGTGGTFETDTDADGIYLFEGLPPGSYRITPSDSIASSPELLDLGPDNFVIVPVSVSFLRNTTSPAAGYVDLELAPGTEITNVDFLQSAADDPDEQADPGNTPETARQVPLYTVEFFSISPGDPADYYTCVPECEAGDTRVRGFVEYIDVDGNGTVEASEDLRVQGVNADGSTSEPVNEETTSFNTILKEVGSTLVLTDGGPGLIKSSNYAFVAFMREDEFDGPDARNDAPEEAPFVVEAEGFELNLTRKDVDFFSLSNLSDSGFINLNANAVLVRPESGSAADLAVAVVDSDGVPVDASIEVLDDQILVRANGSSPDNPLFLKIERGECLFPCNYTLIASQSESLPGGGTIGGVLWWDRDADGSRTEGETGIWRNIPVRAIGPGGIYFTRSAYQDGSYRFSNMVPGEYIVQTSTIDQSAARPGELSWTLGFFNGDILVDLKGTDPVSGERRVAVGAGDVIEDIDFGLTIYREALEETQPADTISEPRGIDPANSTLGTIDAQDPGDAYAVAEPICTDNLAVLPVFIEIPDVDQDGSISATENLRVTAYDAQGNVVQQPAGEQTSVNSLLKEVNDCTAEIIMVGEPGSSSTNFYLLRQGAGPGPRLAAAKSGYVLDRNSDDYANVDESVHFDVLVKNTGDEVITNVRLEDALPIVDGLIGWEPDSDFEPEISQGTLRFDIETFEDGTQSYKLVGLIGEMAPGAEVTAEFRLKVRDYGYSLEFGSLQNQLTVKGDNADEVLSDDPALPGNKDATSFTVRVGPPVLSAKKSASLEDSNGDGNADDGEYIIYTITIANIGLSSARNVDFFDPVGYLYDDGGYMVYRDPGTPIEATRGTPGFRVELNDEIGDVTLKIPELKVLDEAILSFRAVVRDEDPNSWDGYVENQGVVRADGLEPVSTDDPSTPDEPNDRTRTTASEPSTTVAATKTVALTYDPYGNGVIDDGDSVTFTVVVTNTGNEVANEVVFSDVFSASGPQYFHLLYDGRTRPTTTVGEIIQEPDRTSGVGELIVSIGQLPPQQSAVITFEGRIPREEFVPLESQWLANQGLVSGDNFPSAKTDDPSGGRDDDPTIFEVQNPRATLSLTKVAIPVDINQNGQLDIGEPVNVLITVTALGDVGAENVEIVDRLQLPGRWDYGLARDPSVSIEVTGPVTDAYGDFDPSVNYVKGYIPYLPGNIEAVLSYRGIVVDLNSDSNAPGKLGGLADAKAVNAPDRIPSDDPSTEIPDDPTELDVVGTVPNAPPDVFLPLGGLRGYLGQPLEAVFRVIDETPDLVTWSYREPIDGCGFVEDPPVGAEVTFRCETTPELVDGGPIFVDVRDVFGATDSGVFFINTAELPAVDPIPEQQTRPGESIEIPVQGSGGFGGLRVSLSEGAPDFCSASSGGSIVCDPGDGDFGTFTFDVIVTDELGTTARTGVVLNVGQPPRFVTRPSRFDVYFGEQSTLTLVAEDNAPESLQFTVTGLPSWCGISRVPSDPSVLKINCEAPFERRFEPTTAVQVTDSDLLTDSLLIDISSLSPLGVEPTPDASTDAGSAATFYVEAFGGRPDYYLDTDLSSLPPWCTATLIGDALWQIVCNPPAGTSGRVPMTAVIVDANGRMAEESFYLYVRNPNGPPASQLVIEKRAFDPDTGLTLNRGIPLRRGDPIAFELLVTNVGNAVARDVAPILDLLSSSSGSGTVNSDFLDGEQLADTTAGWQCRFPGRGSNQFTICTKSDGSNDLAPGETVRILTKHHIADRLATLEQDDVCDIGVVYWENSTRNARSERICVPVLRPDASFLEVGKSLVSSEADYIDNVPVAVRGDLPFAAIGNTTSSPKPGERTVWYVNVSNTGNRTALDIKFVEDYSDFVTPKRKVIPNFENFEVLVAPPGWGCTDIAGKLLRCVPNEFSNTLEPDESLGFLLAFTVTDERAWQVDEELCNTATVSWEGNRNATNGGEACLTVNSSGVSTLAVEKTLIDGITGEPARVPYGGFLPGDLLDFRVIVANNSATPAVDLGTLVDTAQTPVNSKGKVFPVFQSGAALAYPAGWRCRFISGANRLECRPPAGAELGPGEELQFKLRLRLADPVQGDDIERLCNRAAISWRDGFAAGRSCFGVRQNPVIGP
jgi:hypothetical protein